MITQSSSQTFSDLYHKVYNIYTHCKFEEKGRCETQNDCQDCKQAAGGIHIKYILTLAVWDDKLMEQLKKPKVMTTQRINLQEHVTLVDLENATKDVYKKKKH